MGSLGFSASVMQASIDSYSYLPSTNMTVSGTVYNETDVSAGASVVFEIINGTNASQVISTNSTTADANGTFTKTFSVPSAIGDYHLNVTSGDAVVQIDFAVSDITTVLIDLISVANGSIRVADVDDVSGADETKGILASDKIGNFTYGDKTYYVLVRNLTSSYDTVFVGTGTNFSSAAFKYLERGSVIKINDTEFTLFYINPVNGDCVFVRKVNPVFSGSGSETVRVIALALNSTDEPINNVSVGFKYYGDTTSIPFLFPGTTTFQNSFSKRTNSYGMINVTLSVPSTADTYHVVANGIASVSYKVVKLNLVTSLETENGVPVSTRSPGDTLVLKARGLALNNSIISSDLLVIAADIIGPVTTKGIILSPANNIFTYNYTVPDAVGDYTVKFTAQYNSSGTIIKEKTSMDFEVKDYDFQMMPMAKNRGPSEGFAPNEYGIIIITGKSMSTADFLNLSNLTNNCSSSYINLVSILDENGVEQMSADTVKNVTTINDFFSAHSEIPLFIQNDMKKHFGSDACVVEFRAPSSNGIYSMKAVANISDNSYSIYSTLAVQSMFVHAWPVAEDGSFLERVSPGNRLYLQIDAYDPVTGSSPTISDAEIVEVFSEESGLVTDKMVNEHFDNSTNRLSFLVNDSVTGHHFVKFIITTNESESAMGEGWFDEQLFSAWAHVECQDIDAIPSGGGEEAEESLCGNYTTQTGCIQAGCKWNADDGVCEDADAGKSSGSGVSKGGPGGLAGFGCEMVGSTETIPIRVDVFNAGGTAALSGATATVSEVMSFETMELVSFNQTNVTCMTGDEGNCTLYLTPETSWMSGGHDVKIKITYENVSSYAHAFFMSMNFKFNAWSAGWEYTKNENVSFNVQANEFNGTPLDVNVSVLRASYMGTFDRWMAPKPINDLNNVSAQEISGYGTFVIPSANLENLKPGHYEVMLKARASDGRVEITRADFNLRSFVAYADVSDYETNWDHRYSTSGEVVIQVKGFDSINWSQWPPNGTAHNITDAYIWKIFKQGQWGSAFKNKDELETANAVNTSCSGNICNITLSISAAGMTQGDYDLDITATDADGSEADAHIWLRVETFRITVPDMIEWYEVPKTAALTPYRTINLTDRGCGSSTDDVTEPNITPTQNVTNCIYEPYRIFDKVQDDPWIEYRETYFLIDKDAGTLYVNAKPEEFTLNVGESVTKNISSNEHLNITLNSANGTEKTFTWTVWNVKTSSWTNATVDNEITAQWDQYESSFGWGRFTALNITPTNATFNFTETGQTFTVNVGETSDKISYQESENLNCVYTVELHDTLINKEYDNGQLLNLTNTTTTKICTCTNTYTIEENQSHTIYDRDLANGNIEIKNITDGSVTFYWKPSLRDFTSANTQKNLTINDTFTDVEGNEWNITNIDADKGIIYLKAVDGVIFEGSDNTWDDMLFKVNSSWSKSGTFLMPQSGSGDYVWMEQMWDEEWARVDLDGDGLYGCNYDNISQCYTCERYYMLLTDPTKEGKYDTVWLSPTTDFIAKGVNSSGEIKFSDDAKPIYLTNILYSEESGIGKYKLIFTSNRPGWGGRDLGTFKPGTIVKVPIMVTSPSNETDYRSGLVVNIAKAVVVGQMKFGPMMDELGFNAHDNSITITGANATTGSNGIALISLNTSGWKSGEYHLKVKVYDASAGKWVPMGSEWDAPRISIRNFVVSGSVGLLGNITGVMEWSVGAGNIKINRADRFASGTATSEMWCQEGSLEKCKLWHAGMWEYEMVYYNATGEKIIVDNTPDDWDYSDNYTEYDLGIISIIGKNGARMMLNVTNITTEPYNLTVSEGTSIIHRGMNITVGTVTANTSAEISLYLPWWNWYVLGDYSGQSNYSKGWDAGYVTIEDVGEDSVTLRFNNAMITFVPQINVSLQQCENSENLIKLLLINSTHQLLLYNSPNVTTAGDMEGWCDSYDAVAVIDNSGNVIHSYSIGEIMGEDAGNYSGWAVISTDVWDDRVFMTNQTIGGNVIYPTRWDWFSDPTPEEAVAYLANFTEQSTGFKVQDTCCGPMGEGKILSTTPYYMVLFDDDWNRKPEVTRAMIDDDTCFGDRYASVGGYDGPYDFDGPEQGYPQWEGGNNYSERWLDVGGMSWPFSVVNSDMSSGTALLFKEKDYLDYSETNSSCPDGLHELTFWVQARNFDGTDLNGTVNITKSEGMVFVPWGPPEVVEQNITGSANLINGQAFLTIDFCKYNLTSHDIDITLTITETGTSQTEPLQETLQRHIWIDAPWIQEEDIEWEGPEFGGEEFGPGPGAGNMVMPPCDMIFEQKMCENAWEMGQWCEWKNGTCDFINCSSISNSTKCIEVPHCEWNETGGNETGGYCYEISCAVFDGNQTACESAFDNYGIMCQYIPDTSGEGGLCEPMEMSSGGFEGGYP